MHGHKIIFSMILAAALLGPTLMPGVGFLGDTLLTSGWFSQAAAQSAGKEEIKRSNSAAIAEYLKTVEEQVKESIDAYETVDEIIVVFRPGTTDQQVSNVITSAESQVKALSITDMSRTVTGEKVSTKLLKYQSPLNAEVAKQIFNTDSRVMGAVKNVPTFGEGLAFEICANEVLTSIDPLLPDDDADGFVDEDPDPFNGENCIFRSISGFPGLDDDNDGLIDEDPQNGLDDDGDGSVDEDGPNDDIHIYQWHLQKIKQFFGDAASEPQNKTLNSRVAVLDTGVDNLAPELWQDLDGDTENDMVIYGENCWALFNGIDDDDDGEVDENDEGDFIDFVGGPDQNGHGTAIATTIAGQIEIDDESIGDLRNIGVMGVSPHSTIKSIQVLGPDATGTLAMLQCGLLDALADEKVNIINMSLGFLGGEPEFDLFHAFAQLAAAKNRILVASAGNFANLDIFLADDPFTPGYELIHLPSSAIVLDDRHFSVTGTFFNDQRSHFAAYPTNTHELAPSEKQFYHPNVAAPAQLIISSCDFPFTDAGFNGGNITEHDDEDPRCHRYWEGTSFSAAIVSGALAYIWNQNGYLTPSGTVFTPPQDVIIDFFDSAIEIPDGFGFSGEQYNLPPDKMRRVDLAQFNERQEYVQGIVFDATNGEPIDAEICFDGDCIPHVITQEGIFYFIELNPGMYDATASADGYVPITKPIEVKLGEGVESSLDSNFALLLVSLVPDGNKGAVVVEWNFADTGFQEWIANFQCFPNLFNLTPPEFCGFEHPDMPSYAEGGGVGGLSQGFLKLGNRVIHAAQGASGGDPVASIVHSANGLFGEESNAFDNGFDPSINVIPIETFQYELQDGTFEFHMSNNPHTFAGAEFTVEGGWGFMQNFDAEARVYTKPVAVSPIQIDLITTDDATGPSGYWWQVYDHDGATNAVTEVNLIEPPFGVTTVGNPNTADIILADDDEGSKLLFNDPLPDANALEYFGQLGPLNEYQEFYTDILDDIGEDYVIWDIIVAGVPTCDDLNAKTTKWFTGDDDSNVLQRPERDALECHTEIGRLFLTGQNIAFHLNGREEIRNPETVTWFEDNLHARYIENDANDDDLEGIVTDPIGSVGDQSISTSPAAESARNQDSPDVIDAIGSTDVSFEYSIAEPNDAAVWAPAKVYFAFGLEGVDGFANRVALMEAVQELLEALNPPGVFALLFVEGEEGMEIEGLGPIGIQKFEEVDKIVLNATNVGVATLLFTVTIKDKCDFDSLDIQVGDDWNGGLLNGFPMESGNDIIIRANVFAKLGQNVEDVSDVLIITCDVKEFQDEIRTVSIDIEGGDDLDAENEDGQPVTVITQSLSITILKKGDVNADGVVDDQDAFKTQQFIVMSDIPTLGEERLADIFPAKNGNVLCGDEVVNGTSGPVVNVFDLDAFIDILLGVTTIDAQC